MARRPLECYLNHLCHVQLMYNVVAQKTFIRAAISNTPISSEDKS